MIKKTWGGAREGAGRKEGHRKEGTKIKKSIRLDPDLIKELEEIHTDRTFVSKVEEGIRLYLKKEKGE